MSLRDHPQRERHPSSRARENGDPLARKEGSGVPKKSSSATIPATVTHTQQKTTKATVEEVMDQDSDIETHNPKPRKPSTILIASDEDEDTSPLIGEAFSPRSEHGGTTPAVSSRASSPIDINGSSSDEDGKGEDEQPEAAEEDDEAMLGRFY
jgi:hypothetical protein